MELLSTSVLRRCGIEPDTSVLVALSGGADSVALLLLLFDALRDGNLCALAAAHYHHGLRASAEDDAAFCARLCASLGIPFFCGHGDVRSAARTAGESLETAARRLRYAYLRAVREEISADCIVTAHHADDQAETVLLHLLRGSGLRGLCGMQPRNGDLARPLLGVPRGAILSFLSERGQAYCIDETNDDLAYTRNRVRRELLPLLADYNPRIRESLCSMAELLSEDEQYLSTEAERLLQRSASDGGQLRTELCMAPPSIRTRALLYLLRERCGEDYCRSDVRRMENLLSAQAGTAIELRGGFSAWNDGDILRVGKRAPAWDAVRPIEWENETFCCRADGWKISGACVSAYCAPKSSMEACLCLDAFSDGIAGLYVRHKRDGDRFRPLGCAGTKLVSDVYADRKYAERLRQAPLLFSGEHLLFVPGYTVAEEARVTEQSKTIIYIKIEEDVGV